MNYWSNLDQIKTNEKVIASIGSLIVIVSGSFGSLVPSQVTIWKFYFRNIFAISHGLLIQFGLNKKSVHRLIIIVSVLLSAFITSQVTISKVALVKISHIL